LLSLDFQNLSSPGFRALAGFLSSPSNLLGYNFNEHVDVLHLTPELQDFKHEAVLRCAENERQTSVVCGTLNGIEVVVKFALGDTLNTEQVVLSKLNSKFVKGVPQMGLYGLSNGYRYITLTPVGVHLEAVSHGLRLCVKAMGDVLRALFEACKLGILHRDVSYANIILHDKDGILLDWHVASMTHSPLSNTLTGTSLFLACDIHLALMDGGNYRHTKEFDIESWFYTFLFIASDGNLLWRHELSHKNLSASKRSTVTMHWNHQMRYCHEGFHRLLEVLRDIMFDSEGRFVVNVSITNVLEILEQFLKK